MTAYSGHLVGGCIVPPFEFTALDIVNLTPHHSEEPGQPAEANPALWGTYNDNFPLQYPETARQGHFVRGYVYDYYLRFWIYPNTFREFVLTPVYRTFTIWNAWFIDQTCVDTEVTLRNEIIFDLGSAGVPFTILDLRTRDFDFTIPVDGSAQFTTYIIFDFGVYGSPYVTIIGTRFVTFVWEPLIPMQETLEWKTGIMTGADVTNEQRMSPRPAPRQGFLYPIYMRDEQEQQKLDARLHAWQKRSWGVPIWGEWELHQGSLPAGSTSITLDTTDADFRDDSLIIIYQDEDTYEIALVATVTGTTLTLDDELQNSFSGDKLIMPCRIAQMPAPVKSLMAPDGYAYTECRFLVSDNTIINTFAADQTHKGLTVLTKATYVRTVLSRQSDAKHLWSDYGLGKFELVSDSEFNEVVQEHEFKQWTKAECWEFREFLHSLCGRRVPVFSPTFQQDMIQTRDIGAAGTVLYIQNIGLSLYMGQNNLRNNIAFVFPDGTIICREITDWEEYDDDEDTLQIESGPGLLIEPGDCEICFLDRYRLASDKVTIDWVEAFHNECRLSFIRVQQ